MVSLSSSESENLNSLIKALASHGAEKAIKPPEQLDQRNKADDLHCLNPTPVTYAGNTPPPISLRPQDQRTSKHAGRPINAANAIMNRGVTPHPHAATPGNTLNSLERIGNRLADDLGGLGISEQVSPLNKIAPSYERHFHQGLGEIDQRLAISGMRDSMSPSVTAVSPSASLPATTNGQDGHEGHDSSQQMMGSGCHCPKRIA